MHLAQTSAPYAGQQPDELSQSTPTTPSAVHLNPGQSAVVETTIKVPADASSSERYVVIWAEAQIPSNGPVHEGARTGIRVYLAVPKLKLGRNNTATHEQDGSTRYFETRLSLADENRGGGDRNGESHHDQKVIMRRGAPVS